MKYLIDFDDSATAEQINNYFTTYNCNVVKEFQHFEKVFLVEAIQNPPKTNIVTSVINDEQSTLTLLNVTDPNSESIELHADDEKDWWKVFSCAEFNFEETNISIPRRGSNNRVYILDSGIDKNHSEFQGVDIAELYSVVDNFNDTTGHGTGIASVISGRTCGITNAKLKIVKIFDTGHETKQSELLSAFDAVITDFETNASIPGVVNLSWCIPRNSFIENKILVLRSRGLIVVAAAGNSGQPIDNVTPAAMDNVLTIGSYNQDFVPSNFSSYTDSVISLTQDQTNYGALDGWAPGERINIAMPNGTFGLAGGTSLAAAIHSAIIAYNLDLFYVGNALIPCMDLTKLDGIILNSLKRENFLNLTDIRYANSINRISTLYNKPLTFSVLNQTKNSVFDLGIPVKIGETKCRLLFNPENTSNFELLDTLPNGFILNNGWLIGQPTENIEGDYEMHDVRLRITTIEPAETIELTLHLSAVRPDLTKEDLPADDPNINLVFLQYCGNYNCNSQGFCSGVCYLYVQSCLCIGSKPFGTCRCQSG